MVVESRDLKEEYMGGSTFYCPLSTALARNELGLVAQRQRHMTQNQVSAGLNPA